MRRADHTTISVCVPALDEEATIAGVVAPFVERLSRGEVDRVVVADSGSSDATAERAVAAGAEVVDVRDAAPGPVQGKGDTIRRVLPALDGELLVFVDGDLENVHGGYVTALTAPLLERPEVQLVKGTFERPLNRPGGAAFGGGRVTELLAKPLLEALYPELATLGQPLSGQIGIRRSWLAELALWPGYGLEIGVLLDTYKRAGRDAIAEADLGILLNAHQEITALNGMAKEVLAVVLHHLAREDRFHGDAGAAAPLAPLQVGLCR
jgi:glucosyl-3-phosphoglycerate synthase